MIVYIQSHVYVCVLLTETVSTGLPSHQSTIYALEKYLLTAIVLPVEVVVASRIISLLVAHSVPLSLYSILSQLHLAYKLAGAVLHV